MCLLLGSPLCSYLFIFVYCFTRITLSLLRWLCVSFMLSSVNLPILLSSFNIVLGNLNLCFLHIFLEPRMGISIAILPLLVPLISCHSGLGPSSGSTSDSIFLLTCSLRGSKCWILHMGYLTEVPGPGITMSQRPLLPVFGE